MRTPGTIQRLYGVMRGQQRVGGRVSGESSDVPLIGFVWGVSVVTLPPLSSPPSKTAGHNFWAGGLRGRIEGGRVQGSKLQVISPKHLFVPFPPPLPSPIPPYFQNVWGGEGGAGWGRKENKQQKQTKETKKTYSPSKIRSVFLCSRLFAALGPSTEG